MIDIILQQLDPKGQLLRDAITSSTSTPLPSSLNSKHRASTCTIIIINKFDMLTRVVQWRCQCLTTPCVGASSPYVSFISSKVSFGVRTFKYRNLMTGLASTDSIFAPDYTSAPVKIKMILELQITTSPIKICIMTCVKFQSLHLSISGWGQIFIERPSYS